MPNNNPKIKNVWPGGWLRSPQGHSPESRSCATGLRAVTDGTIHVSGPVPGMEDWPRAIPYLIGITALNQKY